MGGFAGLAGALWVGARKGRFVDGQVRRAAPPPPPPPPLVLSGHAASLPPY